MTKKKRKHRIAILIDGNNLRHGIKALTGSEEIDWKTWVDQINREHELVYVNYYIGKVTYPLFEKEKVEKQSKLINELKKAGINVWLGYFSEQKNEKGVDVQLALDLVVGAMEKHFDTAMLVSGDGDLAHSVQIARHYGAGVILGYIAGTKGNNYRVSWRIKSKASGSAALNDQTIKAHEVWKKKNPHAAKKKAKKKQKNKGEEESAGKIKKSIDSARDTKGNSKDSSRAVRKSKAKSRPVRKDKDKSKAVPSKELLLFCDGGSRGNPGPAGCGAVITDEKGNILKKLSKFIGKDTNNQAEYQAVILGLKEVEKLKPKKLKVYLDSKLIVEQVCGRWKVKKKELRPHYDKIRSYIRKHPQTSFHHIPREKNTEADKMANQAMDKGK
jgi:ribonuclease HI